MIGPSGLVRCGGRLLSNHTWLLVVLHLLLHGLDLWLLLDGHLLGLGGTRHGHGHLFVLGSHAKFALPSPFLDAAIDGDDDGYDNEGAEDRDETPEPDQGI